MIKTALNYITGLDIKYVLSLLIVGLVTFSFYQNNKINHLDRTISIKDSNIHAINTTLTAYQTTTGDLVAQKGALQTSVNDLEALNEELFKKLEKQEGKDPLTITHIEFITISEPIRNVPTVFNYLENNRFKLEWSYKNKGEWGERIIEGENRFTVSETDYLSDIETDITKDVTQMNITTGFRESEDGMLYTYAQTNYPGVVFNQVDGAVLDPNLYTGTNTSSRWSLGLYIGYGVNVKGRHKPSIGLALQYGLIRW